MRLFMANDGDSSERQHTDSRKRAPEYVAEERRRREAHRAALKRMREISDSITLPAGYPDSVELLREDRAR